MSTEAKQYRSPRKKLLTFFERSRDKWKQKCRDAKQRVKSLQTKVYDLHASRERWKGEAKQLRSEIARLQVELEELKTGPAAL